MHDIVCIYIHTWMHAMLIQFWSFTLAGSSRDFGKGILGACSENEEAILGAWGFTPRPPFFGPTCEIAGTSSKTLCQHQGTLPRSKLCGGTSETSQVLCLQTSTGNN